MSYVCDECGESFHEDEAEFALIYDGECVCAFCNSWEGDVDPSDFDGRHED